MDKDHSLTEEIPELIGQLANEDGLIRQEARLKLQAIGRQAVPQLCWMMNNKNRFVRWEAAKALAELADPDSVPWLIKALDDREFDIRWLAEIALIRIQIPALVPLLEALLLTRKHNWLWEGARHVIRGQAKGDLAEMLTPMVNAFDSIDFRMKVPIEARKLLIELRALPQNEKIPFAYQGTASLNMLEGADMPFRNRVYRPFTQEDVEQLKKNQYGIYALLRGKNVIYIGKGDIRKCLLGHLKGDNDCINEHQPNRWWGRVFDVDASRRMVELIREYSPVCNLPPDKSPADKKR